MNILPLILACCLGQTIIIPVTVDVKWSPVVRIQSIEGNVSSWGSGTCIAPGLVVTAWHIIRDGYEFKVNDLPAKVVGSDKVWDLAALVTEDKFDTVNIATERPVEGDTLVVCGYGSGDYREETGKLLKYFSPSGDHPADILSMNVKSRNGDSGGPIFNTQGTLAGVLFGSDNATHGSCCIRVRSFIMGLKIDSLLKERALTIPYKFYGLQNGRQ